MWLHVPKSYPRVVLGGQKDGISSVAFSPDGVRLASASFDGTVTLWDVAKWREIATIDHSREAILAVAFSPNGSVLATGGWGGNANGSVHEVGLWDTESHAMIAKLRGHAAGVTSVTFSPDGKRLVAGSMDGTASNERNPSISSTASASLPWGLGFVA